MHSAQIFLKCACSLTTYTS